MDKEEVLSKVSFFSKIVLAKYNPSKIVLFGSYVNGGQTDESDIDVAVIVDELKGDFLEKEADLYKIRRGIDIMIEPHLFEEGNDKSGFLEEILSYGEVVYER